MSWLLVRAAGLTGIYLLVLTSVAPGDILTGGLLGLAVAVALRPRGVRRTREAPLAQIGAHQHHRVMIGPHVSAPPLLTSGGCALMVTG